jgi:folate-binding Fe-S cluster repair protein YgfZ
MATVAKAKKRRARKRRVTRVALHNTAAAAFELASGLREEVNLLPDRGILIDGAGMPDRAIRLLRVFLSKLRAARCLD